MSFTEMEGDRVGAEGASVGLIVGRTVVGLYVGVTEGFQVGPTVGL